MSTRSIHLGLVGAAVIAFHGATVGAQTSCGDAQLQRGYELRRAGHDDEALVQFRQAWEACHSPRALGQMALAEAALGLWVDADRHLSEALSSASDPWITRSRAQLEDAQTQVVAHVGQLEVRGGIDGAAVFLDNRPVGTLPLREPLRVVAGSATLVVRATGYDPVNRTVIITAGSLVRESIEMVLHVEVSPVRRVEVSPVPRPDPIRRVDVTPSSGGTQRALGWAAAAGAVVFLGGGIAATVMLQGANEYIGDGANLCGAPGRCVDERSTQDTAYALSIVGYAGAGALAVTSAVLLLTAPSRRQAPRAGAALCGWGPGSVGAACAFSF